MHCPHKIAAGLRPLSTAQPGYSKLQCDLYRGNCNYAVHPHLAQFQLSAMVILDSVVCCVVL